MKQPESLEELDEEIVEEVLLQTLPWVINEDMEYLFLVNIRFITYIFKIMHSQPSTRLVDQFDCFGDEEYAGACPESPTAIPGRYLRTNFQVAYGTRFKRCYRMPSMK